MSPVVVRFVDTCVSPVVVRFVDTLSSAQVGGAESAATKPGLLPKPGLQKTLSFIQQP